MNQDVLETGRRVLRDEAEAVQQLADKLDSSFVAACEMMIHCRGRVVVCGIGKSGHVGRKIAASLASLGRPAFFLHAGEAVHGDLGMVKAEDTIVLISHSGETKEILSLLPSLQRIGCQRIAITCNIASSLAKSCDLVLCTHVKREADALNLAPTTSAAVTLGLGDALAVAISNLRNFSAEEFAAFHPGGALGMRLLKDKAV